MVCGACVGVSRLQCCCASVRAGLLCSDVVSSEDVPLLCTTSCTAPRCGWKLPKQCNFCTENILFWQCKYCTASCTDSRLPILLWQRHLLGRLISQCASQTNAMTRKKTLLEYGFDRRSLIFKLELQYLQCLGRQALQKLHTSAKTYNDTQKTTLIRQNGSFGVQCDPCWLLVGMFLFWKEDWWTTSLLASVMRF